MSKKSLRMLAASAIALVMAFGGAMTASADETAPAQTPAANIDTAKKGSITIHKMLNPDSTKPATGEQDTSAKGTALQGVKFTVTKLSLTLDTNADLEKAANLTADGAEQYKTDEATTVTTNGDGVAKFADLAVGVYLVEEQAPVAGQKLIADGQEIQPDTLVPAKPFVVRIPMTNATGDEWNYNVHVYPKNSTDLVKKEVVDAGKNEGDTITYTISVSAPLLVGDNFRTKFEVQDNFDKDKLENVKITEIKVNGATVPAEQYTVTGPNDGKIKAAFNTTAQADGKDKVNYDIPNNATVEVTVTADIKAAGKIVNEAIRIDRDSSMTEGQDDRTKPTNKVVTYEGKVKVTKTGLNDQPLEGAQFDLYTCTADGDGTFTLGTKIDSYTTAADGTFVTKGLHVTDYENDAEAPNATVSNYCLQETKAPAGYVTPEGDKAITQFTLTRADIANEANTYLTVKALDAIKNTPSDTPDLPLTGGQGIALLVVLGVGVAVLAVVAARRNSVKA